MFLHISSPGVAIRIHRCGHQFLPLRCRPADLFQGVWAVPCFEKGIPWSWVPGFASAREMISTSTYLDYLNYLSMRVLGTLATYLYLSSGTCILPDYLVMKLNC